MENSVVQEQQKPDGNYFKFGLNFEEESFDPKFLRRLHLAYAKKGQIIPKKDGDNSQLQGLDETEQNTETQLKDIEYTFRHTMAVIRIVGNISHEIKYLMKEAEAGNLAEQDYWKRELAKLDRAVGRFMWVICMAKLAPVVVIEAAAKFFTFIVNLVNEYTSKDGRFKKFREEATMFAANLNTMSERMGKAIRDHIDHANKLIKDAEDVLAVASKISEASKTVSAQSPENVLGTLTTMENKLKNDQNYFKFGLTFKEDSFDPEFLKKLHLAYAEKGQIIPEKDDKGNQLQGLDETGQDTEAQLKDIEYTFRHTTAVIRIVGNISHEIKYLMKEAEAGDLAEPDYWRRELAKLDRTVGRFMWVICTAKLAPVIVIGAAAKFFTFIVDLVNAHTSKDGGLKQFREDATMFAANLNTMAERMGKVIREQRGHANELIASAEKVLSSTNDDASELLVRGAITP